MGVADRCHRGVATRLKNGCGPQIRPRVQSEIGLIIFSIFTLDGSTPFPAATATLAPIGAVLIIRYGQAGTLAARLLSLAAFTRIGLISYSAYLWHQPILAFYRLHYGPVTPSVAVVAVLVTFGLAQLSWAYVEQPFRKRGGGAGPLWPRGGGTILDGNALVSGPRRRHGSEQRLQSVFHQPPDQPFRCSFACSDRAQHKLRSRQTS